MNRYIFLQKDIYDEIVKKIRDYINNNLTIFSEKANVDEIDKNLKEDTEGSKVEIEFRIGEREFAGGVSSSNFYRIKNEIIKLVSIYYPEEYKIEETQTNEIYYKGGIRETEERYMKKIKIPLENTINRFDYDMRVGFSLEKDVLELNNNIQTIKRDKKRTSIVIPLLFENDKNVNISFDFTIVDTYKKIGNETFESITPDRTYEIELEILWESIEQIIIENQDIEIEEIFNTIRDDLENVLQFLYKIYKDTIIIYTNGERKKINNEIHKIYDKNSTSNEDLPPSFLNKPKDLRIDEISDSLLGNYGGYFVSPKANGLRKLVYFSTSGVYLLNPPYISKIVKSETIPPILSGMLLDAELIYNLGNENVYNIENSVKYILNSDDSRVSYYLEKKFHLIIFDMISIGNFKKDYLDVSKYSYQRRYEKIIELVNGEAKIFFNNLNSTVDSVIEIYERDYVYVDPSFLIPKIFFHKKEAHYFNTRLELSNKFQLILDSKYPYELDGVIFTPNLIPYIPPKTIGMQRTLNPSLTRKWKPKELLTIDLQVMNLEDGTKFVGIKNYENNIVPFNRIKKENIELTDEENEGQIIEFYYDYETKIFKKYKKREDKVFPNFIDAANDLFNLIQSPIEKDVLLGNDLTIMRKYHSKNKKILLEKYGNASGNLLLDIGSGRGGTINQWKRNSFYVFCVEPFEQNYKELLKRAEDIEFKNYKLIPNGGEDTEVIIENLKVNDIPVKMDMVTMFNSLTFFYKNVEMLNKLVNTINESLKIEGYFICVVNDGNKMINLMKRTEDKTYKSKNIEIIRGEKNHEIKISIKNSIVRDLDIQEEGSQTEYLVNINDFISRLRQKNIILETSYYLNKESFLTNEEKDYTETEITLVFKKKMEVKLYTNKALIERIGKFKYKKDIEPDYTKEDKLKDISEQINLKNFYRAGVCVDSNSLINAILYAVDQKYRDSSLSYRKTISDQIRKKGLKIDLETYNTLSPEIKKTYTYREYIRRIMDSFVILGTEVLEIISKLIEANIYVLNDDSSYPSLINNVTTNYTLNIVLVKIGTSHFEPIVERSKQSDGKIYRQTVFDRSSPLIEKISDW